MLYFEINGSVQLQSLAWYGMSLISEAGSVIKWDSIILSH